jgi:hypothetical protein
MSNPLHAYADRFLFTGAALLVVGLLLPWAHRGSATFSGLEGTYFPGGKFALVLGGIVFAILLFAQRFAGAVALATGIVGGGVALLALLLVGKENREIDLMASDVDAVSPGIGLWIFLSGVALLIVVPVLTRRHTADGQTTASSLSEESNRPL